MHGSCIFGSCISISTTLTGRVVLRPGSLYRALHQLVERGCIAEVQDDCDERRRTYRLTAEGRQALAAELAEMSELVRDGRRAGVLSPGAGR